MALEQEKQVGAEIDELFKIARETQYFQGEQFLQWFIKEQVEEVASMTDLLRVVERAKDDPLHGEEYLARETIGDEGRPLRPRRRRRGLALPALQPKVIPRLGAPVSETAARFEGRDHGCRPRSS